MNITEELYKKWAEEGTFYGFPLSHIKPDTLTEVQFKQLKTLVEFYNLSQIDACQRVSPKVKSIIAGLGKEKESGDT